MNRVSMRPAVGCWSALASCAVLVSSLAILPLDARGGDCVDYGEFIRLVGSVDTPGSAGGVAVAGTHAYVADGPSGLQVVDISNPASPAIVGSVDTPGRAIGVAVLGHPRLRRRRRFRPPGDRHLEPRLPAIVGSVDTPGSAAGVAVAGTHAYVADGIFRPAGGRHLESRLARDRGQRRHARVALGVAVAGTHAYVADGYSGLQVVDISNPASPAIVGSVDTPDIAFAVAVAGTHAYVADGISGLQVVDISNPASPAIVGSVDTPATATGVAVAGTHAYVADFHLRPPGGGRLEPHVPRDRGERRHPGPSHARGGGRQATPTSPPTSLTMTPTFRWWTSQTPPRPRSSGSVDTPGDAVSVVVAGTHAYVADGPLGLQVADISNPTSPAIVGSVDTPDFAFAVAVAGTHAYVADGFSGLLVVDISNPASPAIVGSVDTPGLARGVAVAGNYAYVADNDSGLQVVDVSNPASPAIVGSVGTPDVVFDVAVASTHAYLAARFSGLQVVDIANPASPAIVGSVGTPAYAYDVAVAGTHAYVAAFPSDLHVVDVANPASPAIVGSVDTPGLHEYGAGGVAVAGTHAYVADYDAGLQVVDVANPASPAIVGSVGTPGYANDVAVAGTHAYVADVSSGLQILPTQCDIATAVELSAFAAAPVAGAILLTWLTSFELEHLGFFVLRSTIADRGYVRVSEMISPPGPYRFLDVDVSMGIAYFYRLEAVSRAGGSEFYGPVEATALDTAVSPRYLLSQNHPNPFVAEHGATAIGFDLGQRGPAKLQIFNATGRLVRVLVDRPLDAGSHAVWWDGRNDGGAEAASGIYYYRLDAGEFSEVRTLVKVK